MYTGPNPKDVNPNYPDHTYDEVTCLVSGEQKRIIQNRYLAKYGSSREEYQRAFPGAPLKSLAASESYQNAALNDGGMRSKTMMNLNTSGHDSIFQTKRRNGKRVFLESDDSKEYREYLSYKLTRQHEEHGQADKVREYFQTTYQGSEHQQQKRERFLSDNPVYQPGVVDKPEKRISKITTLDYMMTQKERKRRGSKITT